MNIDQIVKDIKAQEPAEGQLEQAAARVRGKLFPQAAPQVSGGAIRGCGDFQELMPAWLAGSLDEPRRMLLEVHTRECVACRKVAERMRSGVQNVVVMPVRPVRSNYRGWAIAATVVMAVGAASWYGYYEYPALAGGPRATVEQIEGTLYRVNGGTVIAVNAGEKLNENDVVRTAKNSLAVLRLNDGSRVELNQRAQVSVSRNWSGSTIHLELGSLIVQAAKQRHGALQVVTADCNVAVKGTVFSVDAGAKGSRVAVIEGTVWVDHGQRHDVLQKGQQAVTSAELSPASLESQFSWSGNAAQYLALAGELSSLQKQIQDIPAAGLRYQSALMSYVPADAVAVAAIPNIGGTIGDAGRIFQQRVASNDTLGAWWKQIPATQRQEFLDTLQHLETATKYLGNEIVIAARAPGGNGSAVLLAQTTQPGLDTYLKSVLPPNALQFMRFENGLFIGGMNPADLAAINTSGAFLQTPLYQKIAPVYQQGAGWMFATDLAALKIEPVKGARFIVAESKTIGTSTENRASVTFTGPREGVASWMAAPAPMRSLDYISPDAGFAAAMMMKTPASIFPEIAALIPGFAANPSFNMQSDLAGALGGEIAIALDGPLLPVPSWKLVAEVYDPGRFQSAMTRMVADFNSTSDHDVSGNLKITQTETDGRAYYRMQLEKLPWEADWTFAEGYWIAAASHELVARAISNKQTGYSLLRADAFRGQLAHDGYTNFSAVIYHNLGQTLTPVLNLLGSMNIAAGQKQSIDALKHADAPGVVAFWAAQDRIDVAARGTLFGMDIGSLLAMGGSPMSMLKGAIGGK